MKLKRVDIEKLIPHPLNYNKHPEEQLIALQKSLSQFGQFRNVVVCNGVILAGHVLVEAAKRSGWTQIDVLERNDLTDDQQKALLLADNKTAKLSIEDDKKIKELLESFSSPQEIPGIEIDWDDIVKGNDFSIDDEFVIPDIEIEDKKVMHKIFIFIEDSIKKDVLCDLESIEARYGIDMVRVVK